MEKPGANATGFDVAAPERGDAELLRLHEALAPHDPRKADVVKQRYFAGLSLEQSAAVLDISARTAERDLADAKARLGKEILRLRRQHPGARPERAPGRRAAGRGSKNYFSNRWRFGCAHFRIEGGATAQSGASPRTKPNQRSHEIHLLLLAPVPRPVVARCAPVGGRSGRKLRRSAGPARDHRRAHIPPAPAPRRSSCGSAVVFTVDVKGKVVAVNVVRTDNREFNQATLDAIKPWTLAPALKDRQPVDARLQQTFVVSVRDLPELNRNAMIAQRKTR